MHSFQKVSLSLIATLVFAFVVAQSVPLVAQNAPAADPARVTSAREMMVVAGGRNNSMRSCR